MTQDRAPGPAQPASDPTRLRKAALVTVAGYVLAFGTPWATFTACPRIFSPASAAQTAQNILAHPSLLAWAIFWMLVNFVGDVLGAWGMYALLWPVNGSVSLLAAWLRLVYTAAGLAAVQNLVTAYRLVTVPDFVTALGTSLRDAQVEVAMGAFQAQFDFALIVFGLYLAIAGALVVRSNYIPSWLGVVLTVDGAGWILIGLGPYLFPKRDLGFLSVSSLGEFVWLVWLVGWGSRLKGPLP